MDTSEPAPEIPAAPADGPTKDERMWAMLCHLGAAVGYLGIPVINVVVPLVIWIIKKDTSAYVNAQGKEAVNAQISFSIYFLIASALTMVLIGFVLAPVVYIAGIVLAIIAGVKANDGAQYRYPAVFRLIK